VLVALGHAAGNGFGDVVHRDVYELRSPGSKSRAGLLDFDADSSSFDSSRRRISRLRASPVLAPVVPEAGPEDAGLGVGVDTIRSLSL
jgi:hypothetical protein